MKLTGFKVGSEVFVGSIEGDTLRCLAQREVFWASPTNSEVQHSQTFDIHSVELAPTIPITGKVVCIGLNYRKHAEESNMAIPEIPVVFSRNRETLICDGDAAPAMEDAYDWEAELGIVIGKTTFAADKRDAQDAVYGYCTFNDLSCRTYQMETPQWALGKNADRSGPMGCVVSADEAGDPATGWAVTTHVNGEQMQNGITSDFIFTVPEIIAFVSRGMTLNPGDLIITGTPAGVGMGMRPQRYLKPGDSVRVEVEGLGAITTPIVAKP